MSARAEELATRLEAVNHDAIDAVLNANGNLGRPCPDEGWTAAAVGAHIGYSYPGIVEGLIKPIVAGREVRPFSLADFDAPNAEQAAANAAMPRDQLLALLRDNGASAVAYVRSLSDDDLDRLTTRPMLGDRPLTAGQVIEMVLIGHAAGHGRSLRQGLA
jgi:hypothetical protein